jgi:hypothetical protein
MASDLSYILAQWIELNLEARIAEFARLRALGVQLPQGLEESDRRVILDMAKEAEPHLDAFLRDNSDKSAEELEEVASFLSPGGEHTGGLLVRLILEELFWQADPLQLAATIRYNWHGGRAGFQFLPDPAQTDIGSYKEQAMELVSLLDEANQGDPLRILTGDDRAFFDTLPARFTIYRGCAGVSIEHAAAGICWTTRREVAEWFAVRSARRAAEPILLSARISKSDVFLVKASEFEVVTMPRRYRIIRCRRRKRPGWRPKMVWEPMNVEGGT